MQWQNPGSGRQANARKEFSTVPLRQLMSPRGLGLFGEEATSLWGLLQGSRMGQKNARKQYQGVSPQLPWVVE